MARTAGKSDRKKGKAEHVILPCGQIKLANRWTQLGPPGAYFYGTPSYVGMQAGAAGG